MDSHELITRNIIEIVEEKELKGLLNSKKKPAVYCGYETSGPVHIGHMVSINKLLDFQNAGLKVKVLFADLHTWLNRKGDLEWIENSVEYWKHCFLALGLKDAEFVKGRDFQLKEKYVEDLFSIAQDTTLNRALRSMQLIARDIEHAHVSQILYPLMQSLDIAHLDLDIAYGGIEQRKIHMLAREHLPNLGYKKPVCLHSPLIDSLQGPGVKMSSSLPETMITIHDSPEIIKARIKKAFCIPEETKNNPVLQIAKFHVFPLLGKLSVDRPEKFGGNTTFENYAGLEKALTSGKLHPQDLKNAVSDSLINILQPVREYFEKNEKARKSRDSVLKT
jgi:tyrosyl-tRNA synthetase